MKARCRNHVLLAGVFLFLFTCLSARANVYATDIRLNGSLQVGVAVPGGSLAITYILNEPATAGASVRIYAGSRLVKTLAAGTNVGLNTVLWNGTAANGSNAADGVYSVSITAAADGYESWTNITDDGTNFFVNLPTGIAVNRNTNSPYYGRVFVANGYDPAPGFDDTPNGILKCNADGSPADEGGFSTGGYSWGNSALANPSPWKMAVGADDRLYVEDWSANGVVVSFDQVLSANYSDVLRTDNYPYPRVSLSGPCVWGSGTNMQIFMADEHSLYLGGLGILSWTLDSNGVAASNDTGTVDVTLTNASDLTMAPYAVSVDSLGNFYTIQRVIDTNDEDARVLCFPPAPDGGPPDAAAIWKIGGGDPTLVNNYGVAVDPTATYVAVATRGYDDGGGSDALAQGGTSIFLASNGSLVTNISQDPYGNIKQEMIDVAWDEVNNLYALDFNDSVWRVYSPPGSNQATTAAIPFIQVYKAIIPPLLVEPAFNMGQLSFTLKGQSNVTYVIQQSPDLTNWIPVATNFSPCAIRPVAFPPPDTQDFYRAVANP
jgi:hypothetical protein